MKNIYIRDPAVDVSQRGVFSPASDWHVVANVIIGERKGKERNDWTSTLVFVFQNHSIHNLDTFTQYLVSLQVFNPEGHGPASTVTVMTDEGGKCERNNKLGDYLVFSRETKNGVREERA